MAPITFSEEQLRSLRSIPPSNYIMASQASAVAQTPATASTELSSQTDYFGSSSQGSSINSSRTSVEIHDRAAVVEVTTQKTKTTNPLPPLSRDYPKPAEDIDVAEALARKPGRWTVQGALSVAATRPPRVVNEDQEKIKRAQALEKVKKELLAASETFKTVTMPQRKNNF